MTSLRRCYLSAALNEKGRRSSGPTVPGSAVILAIGALVPVEAVALWPLLVAAYCRRNRRRRPLARDRSPLSSPGLKKARSGIGGRSSARGSFGAGGVLADRRRIGHRPQLVPYEK